MTERSLVGSLFSDPQRRSKFLRAGWDACKTWFCLIVSWWIFWSLLSEQAFSSPGWNAVLMMSAVYLLIRGVRIAGKA